ncbi:precorrin-6A/cobalt-precorrin-6A reductase [Clostridium acetobutylicum]|uniref:Precorrin-6x reductase n=1 Tax=Clostridium acetobutylicum (strain ATCC 824 / DSM 792 / JCM 1419 / IAM 19013 / LMG 5710 / NBRC 13948 / NRRL B-527 / VKM B-1787 / 2291 / W) TaxID=272562 RepID=Q97JA5_CLOAB|nr:MULTISPECIES: cobalt-precorrin-6A reductase [Clostridium]AAK79349.1 precorrin-6x reductase [Clostridium acetobutylicum ATCC 824]ADZ20432.1 cobalt-precorrin-6x reductase [Clostridium acetobutylicum EA 2018]AEI33294.1 cobalt-precorrin-6x reductase [Clostridium acetobutylicum DSM 1731]AWV81402.1 cobalt-precorrin-6A reductase [Clostridium acetobutylicum]MBC2393037.1 cobalt-precorrin-6A reductase [Clostridium acetobutylicum]
MIALILGTSEGKVILKELNVFTSDILVSTTTSYGGELLKEYKYKKLNTQPLEEEELKKLLLENNVKLLVDASHPYASRISDNCIKICKDTHISYLRYERPSVAEKYKNNEKVIFVKDYEEIIERIKSTKSLNKKETVILNTTGGNNVEKFVKADINSRVVHRILPSLKVLENLFKLGVKVEDIVAIKGPIGLELNKGFIHQYDAKAIILKDSGKAGGTEEKIEAALEEDIYVFAIEREKKNYKQVFYTVHELVNYIKINKVY